MKTFLMLLKREYWEHQTSMIKAPIGLGIALTVFTVLSMMLGIGHLRDIPVGFPLRTVPLSTDVAQIACQSILFGVSTIFNTVLLIVISYYSLSALFEERKDRSILFWKSLPISETNMVVAKLFTALVVTPVAAWVVMMLTGLIGLVLGTISLAIAGTSTLALWQIGTILSSWTDLFLRLFLQSLALFPFVAWLMLCSAYAKRSPFLYAILLPIVLVILEKMLMPFNVISRFVGYQYQHLFIFWNSSIMLKTHSNLRKLELSVKGAAFEKPFALLTNFHGLLQSPYYWFSMGVGAVFICLAIFIRERRYEC